MENLARRFDRDSPQADPEVQEKVRAELEAAGIAYRDEPMFMDSRGEVPTSIVGFAYRWTFQRAWRYWIAKGPGVPLDLAEPFDKEWGQVVRAEGDCACRGPRFWNHGFGTSSYHVDTQEGLNALAKLLASIYIMGEEEA